MKAHETIFLSLSLSLFCFPSLSCTSQVYFSYDPLFSDLKITLVLFTPRGYPHEIYSHSTHYTFLRCDIYRPFLVSAFCLTLTQMFCVCNSHHTMPTMPIVAVKERQIKKSRGPTMMRKASIMTGFLCSARKMRAKRTPLIRGTEPT